MAPPRRYFECHDPQGDWISDLEREDEQRRDAHDEAKDPWGYDEPVDEEPPRDYEP